VHRTRNSLSTRWARRAASGRHDDLAEIAESEGLIDLTTRDALAEALASRFRDEHDKVARVVLRQEDGDPEYGLITRLVPLDQVGLAEQDARTLL
jgi:hypothetical protein